MQRFPIVIFVVLITCSRVSWCAETTRHWAYVAPTSPAIPVVADKKWARNAIDLFTLARMEAAGIHPSPEADRTTLVRRLSFDLLGLPPSISELDEFLLDESPDAYDRLVTRLMSSPHFGERMAQHWLDLARYADTHGYLIDADRKMWRWRDWVIDAYNDDIRFDQFTTEQLAGDLLPNPSLSQLIATGFNRNHMVNYENGAIPEEYQVEYVADRAVTTATVWLGQTIQCARCHDHKYDPFTVKDFYQFFAFFNNISESGLDGNRGNALPVLKAPTVEQQRRLHAIQEQVERLQRTLDGRRIAAESAVKAWEATAAREGGVVPPSDFALQLLFDTQQDNTTPVQRGPAGTDLPAQIDGNPLPVAGRSNQAMLFDGQTKVNAGEFAVAGAPTAWSLSIALFSTTSDRVEVISCVTKDHQEKFQLLLDGGRVEARFQLGSGANQLVIRSRTPLALRAWQHVTVTWDGGALASGVRIYGNGAPLQLVTVTDELSRPISSRGTWFVGGETPENLFRGMMDDVKIFPRELTPVEASALGGNDPLGEILATPRAQRSAEQQLRLQDLYLTRHDGEFRKLSEELAVARRHHADEWKTVPTTMVMQELSHARDTWILQRGGFDRPGEKVTPDTPSSLPALSPDFPRNRLGLARWLMDPGNPLTARVAVNRVWQQFFGAGLVRTAEDFGTRGEPPTDAQLLDWLAVEFQQQGWGVKDLVRLIVTSATYRQSSRLRPELAERDPENRLWARAARLRLDAESIRDGALRAGGLLDTRIGGQSVFPYQPPGLWEEVSYNPGEFTAQAYVQSHGRDLYRRGLYTFWKRTLPPPTMLIFDAPTRETCTVSRTRSNTQLQALVLMNEPALIESARKLAERVLVEGGETPPAQLRFAFRTVTARWPDEVETNELTRLLGKQQARFRREPQQAEKLLAVGESPRDPKCDPAELAAWATVANVLLSLDETITRE